MYPFESILETGIKEIGIIVNETRPAIENLLGDGRNWGVHITYIDQAKAFGLAHVVKISRDFLDGDRFVYILGDNIFTHGIMQPFNQFIKTEPDGLLTIIKHKENQRLGVPLFGDNGELIGVVEKPADPPNEFGIPGLYMFSPTVFNAFDGNDSIKPSSRGELEITDLYTYLINHHFKVEAQEINGQWLDPGKFDDMISAHHFLLDQLDKNHNKATVDELSTVTGSMCAGEGTQIIQSRIVGPAHMGFNTTITNCTIGPYVTIGDNCQLENVAITNSVIYDNTEIKNVKEVIIDSLIGKNSHVWQANHQSVSLFIGDYCSVRLT